MRYQRLWPFTRSGIRGFLCRGVDDLARLAGMMPEAAPHWAVITDRNHRVHSLRAGPTLESLVDQLRTARLDQRCFAVVTSEARGSSEEAVVADWRLQRIAERSDSCFFAWLAVDPAVTTRVAA